VSVPRIEMKGCSTLNKGFHGDFKRNVQSGKVGVSASAGTEDENAVREIRMKAGRRNYIVPPRRLYRVGCRFSPG
jgi:hypothetical protein